MLGASDAFVASEIIPLRCFLGASRNLDRKVFRTSTTPCEGSDVLDIIGEACWWLWRLKCDVGPSVAAGLLVGSHGIGWGDTGVFRPKLPHNSYERHNH